MFITKVRIELGSLANPNLQSGYFHSCQRNAPICCVNPRTGLTFDKPPAPKRLRAFYRALRKRNIDALVELTRRLRESTGEEEISREVGEEYGWTLSVDGTVAPIEDNKIEKKDKPTAILTDSEAKTKPELPPKKAGAGMFFDPAGPIPESFLGDLAIQIHCGDGVEGRNVGFHYDHVNSLFHLALSVHGTRALHYYLREPPKEETQVRCETGWDDEEEVARRAKKNAELAAEQEQPKPKPKPRDRVATREEALRRHVWFKPGDVYATSPALFKHGVEYPLCSYEHRVIAVQARFLLTDQLDRLLSRATMSQSEKIYKIIADFLMPRKPLESAFTLPTLDQVLACEAEIEEYEGPFTKFKPETDRYY